MSLKEDCSNEIVWKSLIIIVYWFYVLSDCLLQIETSPPGWRRKLHKIWKVCHAQTRHYGKQPVRWDHPEFKPSLDYAVRSRLAAEWETVLHRYSENSQISGYSWVLQESHSHFQGYLRGSNSWEREKAICWSYLISRRIFHNWEWFP